MKHNDCFDDKDCDPIIITGACCDPKTVCPSNSQLIELEKLLIALSTAIPTFLTTPNATNKTTLSNLFTQLLALLDSLIPTTEVDYLKQLIQSILAVLTPMTPNTGQLIILLQQFYSALADYFFSIKTCFAPSTLRFLFNLLTQLIIVTSGPTRGGAVIPYASGIPVTLLTLANGLASTGSVVGFGSSLPGIGLVGNNISLALGDFAFVAPRAGTITSLAGFFSVTAAITLPVGETATVGVKLQIFTAPGASTTFVPQTPPLLLPLLTTPLNIGNAVSGIQNLNIPVNAGDKILLYVTADTTFTAVTTVLGFVSAGITID
ncbi:exosporium glycoprotein BclB-related protein [Bacillus hominis]|uniref:exosporium glycoprotein BclB-related protein n=1 Tax=Bacillus hominis TaxID=2817478 RepID=UPI0025A1D7C2|nr:exosporium glycoprotein BclB-related protein [Bacillus hominis]MDM5193708.1 exosporium glycoprotein BclB-related protein [Bacillus hominis]